MEFWPAALMLKELLPRLIKALISDLIAAAIHLFQPRIFLL